MNQELWHDYAVAVSYNLQRAAEYKSAGCEDLVELYKRQTAWRLEQMEAAL